MRSLWLFAWSSSKRLITFSCSVIWLIACLWLSFACSSSLLTATKSLSSSAIFSDCSCNDSNCSLTTFCFSFNFNSASSQFFATSALFNVNSLTSFCNDLIFSSKVAFASIAEAMFNFCSLKSLTCFSKLTILNFRWFFSSVILSRFSLTAWSSTSFCAWWALSKLDK